MVSYGNHGQKYVIIGTNSTIQILAFGTPTGGAFGSMNSANTYIKKLQIAYPEYDFLIVPIHNMPK